MKFSFEPNFLQWYDGMPLSCHHFQQMNVREQKVTEYLLSKIAPYFWGVIELEIDLLNAEQKSYFILKNFECIFADYAIVFFPMYAEEPIELEIDTNIVEVITIYMSISEEHFAYEQPFQRYKSVLSEPVADLNTGENREAISKLIPIVELTNKKNNNLSLPIAKISCDLGQLKLLEYDPPSPDFNSCFHSKNLVQNIISSLSTRVNNSYSKLKIKGEKLDFQEYGQIFMEQLWPLQFALSSKNPSPQMIYERFLCLAVNIASIDEIMIPNFDLKYNHEEILLSFQELAKFIEDKIKAIDKKYSSDLNKFSFNENIYSREIDITQKELEVIMHFTGQFEEWIENAIIISQDKFSEAQMMRIIGCKRDIVDSNKKEMKKGESINFIKVKIDLESEYLGSRTLSISNTLEAENNPIGIYIW